MAIAIRGTPTSAANNAASTTLTINKPTGVVDGDVLIASFYTASATDVSTLAGWTSLQATAQNTNGFKQNTFYKIASGEGASYASTTANVVSAGIIAAYSGCDQTFPAEASSSRTNAASTTITGTAPSINFLANSMYVWFGQTSANTSAPTITIPSALSNSVQQSAGASTTFYAICHGSGSISAALTTAGSTFNNGSSSASVINGMHGVILRPSVPLGLVSKNSNSAGATSVTVTSSASTSVGDLMVLLVSSGSTVTTITGGSSPTWTQVGTTQSTSNAATNLQVFTAKAATSSDRSATYTVNLNASTQVNVALAVWRGDASIRTDNFQGIISNTGATAAITAPTWNGDGTRRVGLAFGGCNALSAGATCTDTGAAWTELVDIANGTLTAMDVAYDVTTSGTGNTGCTFTWASTNTSRAAVVLEIVVASGVPLFFGGL